MDPIDFGYSMKNIPTTSKEKYKLMLTEKIESVLKRMRWKAIFYEEFLKNGGEPQRSQETDDEEDEPKPKFKSRKSPQQVAGMKHFEEDLTKMLGNIKFQRVGGQFQKKLHDDVRRINESTKLFIPADKTQNYYEVPREEYERILQGNITKTYRKSPTDVPNKINKEAQQLAKHYKLADRIDQLNEQQCFVTIKDHKEDFRTNPKFRLINPTKSEMGKLSKGILDRINNDLRTTIQCNQWKDKDAVIDWFRNLEDKSRCSFVVFDIEEFYPSISERLLLDAMEFAMQHTEVSAKEKEVIFHCRKSLLFNNGEPWFKKNGNNDFDVAMGSNDGAEICELVGIYLLHLISQKYPMNDTGLYRDDGLAVIRSTRGRQADQYRKAITKIMKDNGLKAVVKCNLKIVDFLDITFNLGTGKYKPFKKPNNNPRYIHVESNHPGNIIKQIPKSISKRISTNSYDKAIFDDAAPYYNERLKESGYQETINYEETGPNEEEEASQTPNSPTSQANQELRPNNRNRRNRKVIWFNPPFCKSVETKVGKIFLELIDRHFPAGHRYRKIFNRNTIKVSYSCVDNMERIIKRHNGKISREAPETTERSCDCRNAEQCPLEGNCLTTNVVYSATVTSTVNGRNETKKTYIGLTEPPFKRRFTVHKHTFNERNTPNDTSLSKYIWNLKDTGAAWEIKWEILRRAGGYNKSTKKCGICLTEKLLICEFKPKENLINDKPEIVSKCRHQNRHLLSNIRV